MLTPASPTRFGALLVTLALAMTCAATAVAKLPGQARYAGETEEGLPVNVRLSDSGRHVARLRIEYRVVCDNGAEGTPSTTVFDMRIRRRGRFAYEGTYIGRVDGSKNRVRLRGRVTRRVAKGTFRVTATGRPEGSDERVRCVSRRVSWRARRLR